MNQLRPLVFWPTFSLLSLTIVLNFYSPEWMDKATKGLTDLLLSKTQTIFGWGGFAILSVLIVAFFSPLGSVRIGGEKAEPLFKPWNWFAIALGTTTAVGILFWASAEPIYHILRPPTSLNILPGSPESGVFALSTLLMHWTLIPHAIYTLPALLFALSFFNDRKPFSIVSCMHPLSLPGMDLLVDSVCLFCLVVGMSASVATGVLSLAGGIEHLTGIKSSPGLWLVLGASVVLAYLVSSKTGLKYGIRILSRFNTFLFAFLLAYFFLLGPTSFIFKETWAGVLEFISTFVGRSTFTAFSPSDPWPKEWTVFYFANWFAWAPVTGLFLGRISYGYTVRSFILLFLAVLAAFGGIWITVFGNVAIYLHLVQKLPLTEILTQKGAEGVMYFILSQFPYAKILIPVFLGCLFVSCVTAADSNTIAMAALSTKGIDPENPDPPYRIKMIWGLVIGALASAMLFSAGLSGIKTMSILGGFPALFFELICVVVLLYRIVISFKKVRGVKQTMGPLSIEPERI